jgi:uncharacterized protein (TIGR02996 family)
MDIETALLHALHANPLDAPTWLALADWLEDEGLSERAELVRLFHSLRSLPTPQAPGLQEARIRTLLAQGVVPCVPTLTNSIGMRLVLVPPGSFRMGAADDEPEHFHDEVPHHRVTLTRAFYLGMTAVTQDQFQEVVGNNPSHFSPDRLYRDTRSFPVEGVSWTAAVSFCARLSALPAERAAGRVYRLPTEAEWEYACRGAGTSTTAFHFGSSISCLQANFDARFPYGEEAGPYLDRPVPVGTFAPNVLGLYDLHGNVWEWCADRFDSAYYADSPSIDPVGPSTGEAHVLRGGSWFSTGRVCRSACRNATANHETTGFRVAMTAP